MPDITIKAPKGTSYNVVIENTFDILKDEIIKLSIADKKICLISDKKVLDLYGDYVKTIIEDALIVDIDTLSGEQADLRINSLVELLTNAGFELNDYIIALGGALTIDFASYVAATYKEGLNLINIPTSIISMADVAVDGKAGYIIQNLSELDMKIVFPKLVYCNVSCINSLEPTDYFGGFAFIMKTAIVKSASVYEWLIDKLYEISDRDSQIVKDMIEQNINLKRIYMEKDPLCTKGDQLLLDFGQSLAWAFYDVKKDELSFGECLALGVISAAYISMKRDMLSLDEYLEIRDMFVPFNLPISVENVDVDQIVELSHKYTKCDEQGNCFILLKKIGKAVIDRNVTDEEIKAAISEIKFSDDDFVIE